MTRVTCSFLLTTLLGAGAFLLMPVPRTSAQAPEKLDKKPTPVAVEPGAFLRIAREMSDDKTLDLNSRVKVLEAAGSFLRDMKLSGTTPARQDVQGVVSSSVGIMSDLGQNHQESLLSTYVYLKRVALALGHTAEADVDPALPLLLSLSGSDVQVMPPPPYINLCCFGYSQFGSMYNPGLPPWQRYVLSREYRIAAIEGLGNARAVQALPALTDLLLRDPYPQAVPPQRELLRGINANVRQAAAVALGKIGQEASVPYLAVAVAGDPSADVRRAAQEAIAAIRKLPVPGEK